MNAIESEFRSGPSAFLPEGDNPYLSKAVALCEIFARDAVERDKRGGCPSEQIDLLKQSGLLTVALPKNVGGQGEPISTVLQIVRLFGQVDGSIAHLYGYHAGQLLLAEWEAAPEMTERLHRRSVAENWFWGNTVNSFSRSLEGKPVEGGYLLNGFRPFSSGSHVADYLNVAWEVTGTDQTLLAAIPANRDGIVIEDDWDGFGQRQTGSGRVSYHDVFVDEDEIFKGSATRAPWRTVGILYGQNVLLNVFVGTAQGALLAGRDYTINKSRPWVNSGVGRHIDDPWVKRVYGTLYTKTIGAALMADRAAEAFDAMRARGEALTEREREKAAAITAAANVLTGDVALEVSSAVFEVMGARSASMSEGYDRFWRNVRIHTLHNPAEYKTRNVGYWFLTGFFPVTAYE